MSQEPISIILLDPVIDSMGALVRVLEKSKQFEILNVPTTEEALQVAQQFLPCVILVSLRGSLDGASQVELLKKLEKPIRAGQLKALVISSVKNHPLARDIAAIGVTDYAEEPITPKSLLFKINLIFKAIVALRKRNDSSKGNEQMVFKADDGKKSEESVTISAEVPAKYKPALQFGEDTFVFKGTPPKKIGQKYILEAEGPLPDTGDWVAAPGKKGEEQKWKWVPKINPDEEEAGNKEDGWIHDGEKPAFDGSKGKWQLTSQKPRLEYFKDGRAIGSKVETDEDGNVVIAEDSQMAKENLMINKTLAAQAREEFVKKIVAVQEKERQEEEAKKLGKKNLETEKVDVKEGNTKNPENRTGTFANKVGEQKDEPNRKIGKSKAAVEDEQGGWDPSAHRKELAEKKLQKRRAQEEKDAELERTDKRKKKNDSGSGAGDLELQIKEKSIKGLEKDDLAGDQNIRDKIRPDLELNLGKEESPEGISKDQLESDQNSFQKREGKGIKNLVGREKKPKEWNEVENDLVEEEDREQQTDLESEEDDIQRTRNAKSLEKAKDRAQKRIAELKKQTLEEAARPLNDDMTEEEERALRHELGAMDRPELTKRELKQKARLEKAKASKKEIHDINESLDGRGVPLEALFPAEEESEWGQQDSDDVKKKRNFRAIDSVDEDAEDLFGLGKKKKDKNSREEKAAIDAEVFFLMQAEVQPEEGSWECEDNQWIYLPNSVFESGFERIEDLLPAWIFAGEDEPELLVEEKKWKFIASKPRKVDSVSDLPRSIKDLLTNLRNQASMALGKSDYANAIGEISEKVRKERFEDQDGNTGESLEAGAERGLHDDQERNHTPEKRGRLPKSEKNGTGFEPEEEVDSINQGEDIDGKEGRETRKKRPLKPKNAGQEGDEFDSEELEESSRRKLNNGDKKDLGKVVAQESNGKNKDFGKVIVEEGEDPDLGDVSQENATSKNGFGKVELEELDAEEIGKVLWEKEKKKKARRKRTDSANENEDIQPDLTSDKEDDASSEEKKSDDAENYFDGDGNLVKSNDEDQEDEDAGDSRAELSDEEELDKDTEIDGQKPEFSMLARELLVLVVINDAKRRKTGPEERIPLFVKTIGAAFPDFRCRFSRKESGGVAVGDEDFDSTVSNEISIRVESRLDSREIGALFVLPPDGRNKLSRREAFVFNQFAAALAQLFDRNNVQDVSKAA